MRWLAHIMSVCPSCWRGLTMGVVGYRYCDNYRCPEGPPK